MKLPVLLAAALVAFLACSGAGITASPDLGREAASAIYIPKDLEDSFAALRDLLDPADVDQLRSGSEADVALYHFGLGRWMRNNWGLWGGSRLSRWFNDRGIHHPDDMSGIILTSFWRHLNGKPLGLDAQIERYQIYWDRLNNQ
ncbi:MAG TPA: hypothetical protein EYP07_12340 [Kiloniellaceae bacterium]|nr:hypothetical protein [Kiloniellaceae bacterium]